MTRGRERGQLGGGASTPSYNVRIFLLISLLYLIHYKYGPSPTTPKTTRPWCVHHCARHLRTCHDASPPWAPASRRERHQQWRNASPTRHRCPRHLRACHPRRLTAVGASASRCEHHQHGRNASPPCTSHPRVSPTSPHTRVTTVRDASTATTRQRRAPATT
jgi:hypothetical protein